MLAGDGLGGVSFGASGPDVVAAVTSTLGAPVSDQTTHWSNGVPVMEPGATSMNTRAESWNQPVSRTVCWGLHGGMCVDLGGDADDDLRFVGWFMIDPILSMPNGLGIGSRVSDFPALGPTLQPESCTDAWGTFRDVAIGVHATAVPFLTVDTDGNEIPQQPDPTTLVVDTMQAGYNGDNDGQVCAG